MKETNDDTIIGPVEPRPFRGELPVFRFKYRGVNWRLRVWRGDRLVYCGKRGDVSLDVDRREITIITASFRIETLDAVLCHARDAITRDRWRQRRESRQARAA